MFLYLSFVYFVFKQINRSARTYFNRNLICYLLFLGWKMTFCFGSDRDISFSSSCNNSIILLDRELFVKFSVGGRGIFKLLSTFNLKSSIACCRTLRNSPVFSVDKFGWEKSLNDPSGRLFTPMVKSKRTHERKTALAISWRWKVKRPFSCAWAHFYSAFETENQIVYTDSNDSHPIQLFFKFW